MKLGGRRITVEGVLRTINDLSDEILVMDRRGYWKKIFGSSHNKDRTNYFPSEVERAVVRLARKGWVKKRETDQGLEVTITDKGRRQVMMYALEEMRPKKGRWDGKWRVVFFDVDERSRKKRDRLRKLLRQLGFWEYQESVYICPHDMTDEIRYVREALEIPHGVKLGVLEKIENEEELKQRFGL